MKSKIIFFAMIAMLVLASCGQKPNTSPDADDADISLPLIVGQKDDTYPVEEIAKDTLDEVQSQETYPINEDEESAAVDETLVVTVLAPSSTTSIPILLAAKYLPGLNVEIFENHPQANAQFMAEEDLVLVTGLSVGFDMFKNDVPLQLINTNVTGLSYIVSCNFEINSFAELDGHEIYIPFEGSPLEETTKFFVEQAGLVYGEDVKPIYAPFETSTALIKNGDDAIVAIPQPAATAMAAQECGHLGVSFYDTWNEITGDTDGYPQVGAFSKAEFANEHPEWIIAFNQALAKAIADIQENPEAAMNEVADKFSFPAPILLKALQATKFTVQSDQEMKDSVIHYYRTIGKPLDESYEAIFYAFP